MERFNSRSYKMALSLSKAFSFSFLQNRMKNIPFVPVWHSVSDSPLKHIENIYKVNSAKEFEKTVDFILKYFDPIDLESLAHDNWKRNNKHVVHFTFDDGLRECYDIIAPLLLKKGVPASFFINSAFVDNNDLFYRYKQSVLLSKLKNGAENEILKERITNTTYKSKEELNLIAQELNIDFSDYLFKEKPYMTLTQLKDLNSKGFHIGAHSVDHPLFVDVDVNEQIRQVNDSVEFVKTHFENKLSSFAFPFTEDGFTSESFETIYSENNIDVSFGTAGLKEDAELKHFQRVPMEGLDVSVEKHLKAEYLKAMLRSVFSKNIVKR